MRSHDNQVALGFASRGQDLGSRVAGLDAMFNRDVGTAMPDQIVDFGANRLGGFNFEGQLPELSISDHRNFPHMHHNQACAMVPRQGASHLKGGLGWLGEVRRLENGGNSQHGSLLSYEQRLPVEVCGPGKPLERQPPTPISSNSRFRFRSANRRSTSSTASTSRTASLSIGHGHCSPPRCTQNAQTDLCVSSRYGAMHGLSQRWI